MVYMVYTIPTYLTYLPIAICNAIAPPPSISISSSSSSPRLSPPPPPLWWMELMQRVSGILSYEHVHTLYIYILYV